MSHPTTTIPLRLQKAAQMRVHIFKVGWKLMNETSDVAPTVDRICAEAGVSKRTFFSYFKRKDDLLVFAAKAWNVSYAARTRPQGLSGIAYLCRELCAYNARYPEFLAGPILSMAHRLTGAEKTDLANIFQAVDISSLEQSLLENLPLSLERPPPPTLLDLLVAHIDEAKSAGELQADTDEAELATAVVAAIYGSTLVAAMRTDVSLQTWMEKHVFRMLASSLAGS